MILAICCYADDITVYGRISNLTKVMKDTTRWAKETLGLTIKSAWDIIHFASFDAERQQNKRRKAGSHQRTPGLDMMGYVVCAVVESAAHYEPVGRNQAQRQPGLLPEVQCL